MSENTATILFLQGGAKGEQAKAVSGGVTAGAGADVDAESFSLFLEQASESDAVTPKVPENTGEQFSTDGTNEPDTDESGAVLKPVLPISSGPDVDILPVPATEVEVSDDTKEPRANAQAIPVGQGKAAEHADPSSATKANSINGQQAIDRIGVGRALGQVVVSSEQTPEATQAKETPSARPTPTGLSLAAEKVSENADMSQAKDRPTKGLERAVEALRAADVKTSGASQGAKSAAEVSRPSGGSALEDATKVSDPTKVIKTNDIARTIEAVKLAEIVRTTEPVRAKVTADAQVPPGTSDKPVTTPVLSGSGSQGSSLGQQAQSQQPPAPPIPTTVAAVPATSSVPIAQVAPVLQEVQPAPVPTVSSTAGSGASTTSTYSSTLDLTNEVALKGEAMRLAGNLKAFGPGGGTASLLLKPENLGTVHVKMEIVAGRLIARMTVESVVAEAALQKALPQLEQAFRGQGFTDVRINLAAGNPNLAFAGEAGGRSNSQGRGQKANDDDNVTSLDEKREILAEQSLEYSLSGRPESVDIVV